MVGAQLFQEDTTFCCATLMLKGDVYCCGASLWESVWNVCGCMGLAGGWAALTPH